MDAHHANRFQQTTTLHLNAAPERVFPLFGPIREGEWASEWSPRLIHSDSPLGEAAGTVFTTQQHQHHSTVWYVIRFDVEQHLVEYVRVTPEFMLVNIVVQCVPTADHGTAAQISYTFVALSDDGEEQLAVLRQHHAANVRGWEPKINAYLATQE